MKKLVQAQAAEIALGIIVLLAVLIAYATLSLTEESPQLAAAPTTTPTPENPYTRLADMALRPEQLPAGYTWQGGERTYDNDPSQPLHNLDSDLPPEARAALLAYEAAYKITAIVPNGFAGQYLYYYPSAGQAEQASSLFTTMLIESGRVLDISEPAGDSELQGQTITLKHVEIGNTFFFIGSLDNVLMVLVVDGLDDGTTEETFRNLVAVLLQGQPHASLQPTATVEPTPAGTTIYYQAGRIFEVAYTDGAARCVDSTPGSGAVFGASPGGQRLLFQAGRNHGITLREHMTAAPQYVAEQVAWANWVDQDNFYFNTLDGEIYWTEITGEELDTRFITEGAAPSYCPAGNLLAFTRPDTPDGELGGLYVRDLNPGGTERLVTTEIARNTGILGNAPQWTADCEWLIFLSDPTDASSASAPLRDWLAFVSPESGEIRRAVTSAPTPSTPFYFSPATNRLLYGSGDIEVPAVTTLLQVDPAAGTAEIIEVKTSWNLGWGEVGRSVIVWGTEGHVLWDLDSAETIPIQACEL